VVCIHCCYFGQELEEEQPCASRNAVCSACIYTQSYLVTSLAMKHGFITASKAATVVWKHHIPTNFKSLQFLGKVLMVYQWDRYQSLVITWTVRGFVCYPLIIWEFMCV
jgi:hypothetical protein